MAEAHGWDDGTEERRLELLERYATESDEHPFSDVTARSTVFLEIPTLELELRGRDPPPVDLDNVEASLKYVRRREDCADFTLAGLLRILYRYADSDQLPDELFDAIEDRLLDFPYWFTEPGRFSGPTRDMCFHTENHQILFHTAELLAGQLLPDSTFENGESGDWHRETARRRIDRWLGWRARFGFSEWNSNTYFDEDLLALVNLIDYAEDEEIRRKAELVTHLFLFEMAVNSFDGAFGSSHGRAYTRAIIDARQESVSPVQYLCFGRGALAGTFSFTAVQLATSGYAVPSVIQAIARHNPEELENRERHNLNVEDAAEYGVDPADPENIGLFWGQGVAAHPLVLEAGLEACPEEYYVFEEKLAPMRDYLAEDLDGERSDVPDPNSTALTQVDLYTFRTPDYMLSCAQDYRPGLTGFQQHIWQATLGERAVVFTNHPGTEAEDTRPGYWHGNGILPRAAAYRNVAVCLYRFDADPDVSPADYNFGERTYPIPIRSFDDPDRSPPDYDSEGPVPYTHAYFPRFSFDEWTEAGDWVFGRRDGGYVALRSLADVTWTEPREGTLDHIRPPGTADWDPGPFELVADGTENAWICELGRRAQHGSFTAFVDRIAESRVEGDTSRLEYESPSLGPISFGWETEFVVEGESIPLAEYPRFDNPYCAAPFGSMQYTLRHGGDELHLDFESP